MIKFKQASSHNSGTQRTWQGWFEEPGWEDWQTSKQVHWSKYTDNLAEHQSATSNCSSHKGLTLMLFPSLPFIWIVLRLSGQVHVFFHHTKFWCWFRRCHSFRSFLCCANLALVHLKSEETKYLKNLNTTKWSLSERFFSLEKIPSLIYHAWTSGETTGGFQWNSTLGAGKV